MSAPVRACVALAFACCIGGCATPSSIEAPSAVVTSPRARVIPADRARNGVTIGRSTKADVIAALGETLVINFDTGYEVWVYQLADSRRAAPAPLFGRRDPEKAAELVVLFAPSGVVTKTRVRPSQ